MKATSIIALIFAVIGGFILLTGIGAANGAPQEAAAAAIALAVAGIPYMIASLLQRERIMRLMDERKSAE
jgi:outer membrane lipoprotein SlyB